MPILVTHLQENSLDGLTHKEQLTVLAARCSSELPFFCSFAPAPLTEPPKRENTILFPTITAAPLSCPGRCPKSIPSQPTPLQQQLSSGELSLGLGEGNTATLGWPGWIRACLSALTFCLRRRPAANGAEGRSLQPFLGNVQRRKTLQGHGEAQREPRDAHGCLPPHSLYQFRPCLASWGAAQKR